MAYRWFWKKWWYKARVECLMNFIMLINKSIKFQQSSLNLCFACFQRRCDLEKEVITISGDDMMSNNDGKLKRKDFEFFLAMQWLPEHSSYIILIIAPKLFREKTISLRARKYNSAKKCFAVNRETKFPQNTILQFKLSSKFSPAKVSLFKVPQLAR